MACNMGASIGVVGDIFDVMQGKEDKRRGYSSLKEELKHDDYVNRVIDYAAKKLEPYARNIDFMSKGNHETSFLKNYGVDLIALLVEKLNAKTGSNIKSLPYTGWVIYRFIDRHKHSRLLKLKYYHSRGAYSKQTKGITGALAMSATYPDADILVTGDTHSSLNTDHVMEFIGNDGKIFRIKQQYLGLSSYKDDQSKDGNGWATESHLYPRTMGCTLVNMTFDSHKRSINHHYTVFNEAEQP